MLWKNPLKMITTWFLFSFVFKGMWFQGHFCVLPCPDVIPQVKTGRQAFSKRTVWSGPISFLAQNGSKRMFPREIFFSMLRNSHPASCVFVHLSHIYNFLWWQQGSNDKHRQPQPQWPHRSVHYYQKGSARPLQEEKMWISPHSIFTRGEA